MSSVRSRMVIQFRNCFGELLFIKIFVLARIIRAEIQMEREERGAAIESAINSFCVFIVIIGE